MHTLWGRLVRAIDCSDGVTAAITQDGALFTWGALCDPCAMSTPLKPLCCSSSRRAISRCVSKWLRITKYIYSRGGRHQQGLTDCSADQMQVTLHGGRLATRSWHASTSRGVSPAAWKAAVSCR